MARSSAQLLAVLLLSALAPAAAADVLIGVAGPRQGPSGAVADDIARGAKLAAERINADGGVLGEPIQIIEADDGCEAAQAETAAKTLASRGVALVIGHPCASAAITAARIYAQAGIVFIAPATRHPALTNQRAGPTVFRLTGRDDRQGTSAGDYLARTFQGKPLALVADGSRTAQNLIREALAALKLAGHADVLTTGIEGGQKEYARLVARLGAAGVEALLFAGFPIEGGLLLTQMREAGLKTVFLGSDMLANAQLAETAGSQAEGARALLPHNAAAGLSESTLRERFGVEKPTGSLVSAYAAVEAWRAAVVKAATTAAPAVAEVLQQGTLETVLGPVSFDEKGDARIPSYDIVEWKNGVWRPLE